MLPKKLQQPEAQTITAQRASSKVSNPYTRSFAVRDKPLSKRICVLLIELWRLQVPKFRTFPLLKLYIFIATSSQILADQCVYIHSEALPIPLPRCDSGLSFKELEGCKDPCFHANSGPPHLKLDRICAFRSELLHLHALQQVLLSPSRIRGPYFFL